MTMRKQAAPRVLKKLFRNAGLTYVELSVKLECSPSHVYTLLSDPSLLTSQQIKTLASLLYMTEKNFRRTIAGGLDFLTALKVIQPAEKFRI